ARPPISIRGRIGGGRVDTPAPLPRRAIGGAAGVEVRVHRLQIEAFDRCDLGGHDDGEVIAAKLVQGDARGRRSTTRYNGGLPVVAGQLLLELSVREVELHVRRDRGDHVQAGVVTVCV